MHLQFNEYIEVFHRQRTSDSGADQLSHEVMLFIPLWNHIRLFA